MQQDSNLQWVDRPWLPPGSEVFLSGENKLMLRTRSGTTLFSGDLVGPQLIECIRSLDGTKTLSQALAPVDAAHRDAYAIFLRALAERRLLSGAPAGTDDLPAPAERSAYEHHEAAYWSLHASSAQDARRRLQAATVLISGLGGVGVALASALAVAGVGKLILLDPHRVRASDLQLGYSPAALGAQRAEALAAALRDSRCAAVVPVHHRIESDTAWDELVASSELVVMASDNMALSGYERTNESCLRLGKPWISARIDRDTGVIGPYVVPGQTACFACYELRTRANADHSSDHESMYRHWHKVDDCPSDWPVLQPMTQLLGSHLALDVQRVMAGKRLSAAHGKVLHIDFDSLACQAHEILKLPRCPACSRSRLRPLTRIWDLSEAPATKGGDR